MHHTHDATRTRTHATHAHTHEAHIHTTHRVCVQVSIGTVHLESLDQAPYREKQLEIIAG
jgi:hypothetical protein